jgi:hypothetical protein
MKPCGREPSCAPIFNLLSLMRIKDLALKRPRTGSLNMGRTIRCLAKGGQACLFLAAIAKRRLMPSVAIKNHLAAKPQHQHETVPRAQ